MTALPDGSLVIPLVQCKCERRGHRLDGALREYRSGTDVGRGQDASRIGQHTSRDRGRQRHVRLSDDLDGPHLWFDTMARSVYKGGVYCNTTDAGFVVPFCAWYGTDMNRQHDAYVYTTQPNSPCDWLHAADPVFSPTSPALCAPPVLLWQRTSGANVCHIDGTEVDLDRTNQVGVMSMW